MSIFSKAWYKAMVIPNIVAAFRTTGIYPLNRHAIHIEDPTAPIDTGSESLAEETGLPYIPFYTPIRSHRSKSVTHNIDQAVRMPHLIVIPHLMMLLLKKSMPDT